MQIFLCYTLLRYLIKVDIYLEVTLQPIRYFVPLFDLLKQFQRITDTISRIIELNSTIFVGSLTGHLFFPPKTLANIFRQLRDLTILNVNKKSKIKKKKNSKLSIEIKCATTPLQNEVEGPCAGTIPFCWRDDTRPCRASDVTFCFNNSNFYSLRNENHRYRTKNKTTGKTLRLRNILNCHSLVTVSGEREQKPNQLPRGKQNHGIIVFLENLNLFISLLFVLRSFVNWFPVASVVFSSCERVLLPFVVVLVLVVFSLLSGIFHRWQYEMFSPLSSPLLPLSLTQFKICTNAILS